METIGLIAAMPQESGALLHYIKKWKKTAFGPIRGVRFQLLDRNNILVTSGMGHIRAMDVARTLVKMANPQLLISFGIAGAVNNDLKIGDVVVAGTVCQLVDGNLCKFLSLASFSMAAWSAAAQALSPYGVNLVSGTAITTCGSQVILHGQKVVNYPVLEMETAGIAQVAAEMGIPLLSIRSISDCPQSPIPFNLGEIFDDEYRLRYTKVLRMILSHPQIIFKSRFIMQNSLIAADHAAIALNAVLCQPSPIINS